MPTGYLDSECASSLELDRRSHESYDVSVVIPTYNRELSLPRTLETLLHQRADSVRFEILVVDNNSSDDTRRVVERFADCHPPVRYFFEPRQGVSHARNTGIAAAHAPLVAFIDDDVEADAAWVATIKRTFDDHPEIDCIGGKVEARWAAPPPAWLTPRHWGAVALQADKGDTPYVDAEHASPCLITANFASRRTALEEVGGFSPDFPRSQDREIQLRLWDAGKRGLYVGSLLVTTEVPRERLTKTYHRRFQWRVGGTHARMWYRDRLDRDGRLIRNGLPSATFLGAPGFLYRSLISHAVNWLRSVASRDWVNAFFHESRVLYYGGYIWTRYRQVRPRLRTLPLQFVRFARTVARSRRRTGCTHETV